MGYVPPKIVIPKNYTREQRGHFIDTYRANLIRARDWQSMSFAGAAVCSVLLGVVVLALYALTHPS